MNRVALGGGPDASVLRGVLERQLAGRRSIAGLTTGFVPFSHALSTLFLRARMVSVRYSVAFGSVNLRGVDNRPNRLVRQRGDDARRPEPILGTSILERGIRVLGLPALRLELGRLDTVPTAGMSGYDTLIQGRT